MAAGAMAAGAGDMSLVEDTGLWAFTYNRYCYKFDNKLRFARFNAGRGFANQLYGMYRDDVADLTSIPIAKMAIYTPVTTLAMGYCVTIFVEGRSGLKFPAPPTFVSGLYLNLLCTAFAFLLISTWMTFSAALKANAIAVQLRTRKVRLPVPTQKELDGARRLMGQFEEQRWSDILRLPYVMPLTEAEKGEESEGAKSSGSKGSSKKRSRSADSGKTGALTKSNKVHVPGRPGNTGWAAEEGKELRWGSRDKKVIKKDGGCQEGEYQEHFELVRQAQYEYWSYEIYGRICFLYGMISFLQAFGYWMVIHCISELLLIWSGYVVGAAMCAAQWLIFRLDVLPSHTGGFAPIEACGPLMAAITLTLTYCYEHTPAIKALWHILTILTMLLQMGFTLRMFIICSPAYLQPNEHGTAMESGGDYPNFHGSCAHPFWLPSPFQHVLYLVAPPLPTKSAPPGASSAKQDPMQKVDMKPWYTMRAFMICLMVSWVILLAGRVVEIAMGERMLITNPGQPPWSRRGLWEGFEWGPYTMKHYAHVTPKVGHFAYEVGRGPNGNQIGDPHRWPSDLYGFHIEADYHWRRLRGVSEEASAPLQPLSVPSVPAAVSWPSLFEPEHVACEAHIDGRGRVLAISSRGSAALVSAEAAAGSSAADAQALALEGITHLGPIIGASWLSEGLHLVLAKGVHAVCPGAGPTGGRWRCSESAVPRLPIHGLVTAAAADGKIAAVATRDGSVSVLGRHSDGWEPIAAVEVPRAGEAGAAAAVSITDTELLVAVGGGAVHRWGLLGGLPRSSAPSTHHVEGAGSISRSVLSACTMGGEVLRLASHWRGPSSVSQLLI